MVLQAPQVPDVQAGQHLPQQAQHQHDLVREIRDLQEQMTPQRDLHIPHQHKALLLHQAVAVAQEAKVRHLDHQAVAVHRQAAVAVADQLEEAVDNLN